MLPFPDRLLVTCPSPFASPVMDGRRLRLLLLDHASCHRVLANSTEENEAGKLVEVVKDYMLLRAKKFVADCDGRAVLFSYGSDGTRSSPARTSRTCSMGRGSSGTLARPRSS